MPRNEYAITASVFEYNGKLFCNDMAEIDRTSVSPVRTGERKTNRPFPLPPPSSPLLQMDKGEERERGRQ